MKEYYKIGEISKLYNVGTDSLRYYERLGILKPKRDKNDYRMYSIYDIRTLNILRELRSIGFSVTDIKDHLSNFNLKKTVNLFEAEISAVDKKISELKNLKEQLNERINSIGAAEKIVCDGKIKIKYMGKRYILKLSENVVREEDLDFIIKKLQAKYENSLYLIGNGQAGATIPFNYLNSGNYGHFDSAFYDVGPLDHYDETIPEGRYISLIVKGSYDTIPSNWKLMLDYISKNNLTPLSKAMEFYIIDNHDTGVEEEYITELQIQIE